MSISIDPSKNRASPVSKSGVIGKSGGKKVVDLTQKTDLEQRARDRVGLANEADFDKDQTLKLAQAVISSSGKPIFSGDPELSFLLDRYMSYVTGEKNFDASVGSGARFGFLGQLARRLPSPILLDNEDLANDLFPGNNKTFCVDPAGRMWIYADFLHKCIKADQEDGLMTLPVLNHEHLHVALNHCMRMHNFDPRISNIAKDTVINPMVKAMYPSGTKFAKDFENAWGNDPEHKRFQGLSEETVATIMQTEAVEALAEKGTIRIKLLEIVDGPVSQKTVLKAGKGEVIDLDHVLVTVEELFDKSGKSVDDNIDTDFDCATVEIEQTINRLKTRHRQSEKGEKNKQDNVIDIPTESNTPSNDEDGEPGKPKDSSEPSKQGRRRVNPNDPVSEKDSGVFNQNAGHEIDMEKIKEVLKKHGYGDMVDNVIKPDSHSPENMDVLLQSAMNEAQIEQSRLGSYYPGGHVDEYMRDVVKPSAKLRSKVTWKQRTKSFLEGSGPLLTRSMEEQSVLNLLDPEDLGLEDDEVAFLPGLIPTKPDGRIGILIDSSGSMDEGRLVEAVGFILALKKSANDLSPDIDVFSADTSLRGKPIKITEETISKIASEGIAIFGRGGTEIAGPLNQIVAYAEKERIKYNGVLYITDFGLVAPGKEDLPKNLPPLMFLGIPSDYKASESVIRQLREYSEVVCIDKNMELDMNIAESKSSVRGQGIKI